SRSCPACRECSGPHSCASGCLRRSGHRQRQRPLRPPPSPCPRHSSRAKANTRSLPVVIVRHDVLLKCGALQRDGARLYCVESGSTGQAWGLMVRRSIVFALVTATATAFPAFPQVAPPPPTPEQLARTAAEDQLSD